MTRRSGFAALTFAAVGCLSLAGVPAAGASGAHRAAVIVEANGVSVRRIVTFSSDSISGLDALRQAGGDPVTYGFSGIGAAVCAVHVPFGGPVVGCPGNSSCLTCGGSNYWAYFRAPGGTSKFVSSRAGAGSTRVHDGDVEGWRWGSGDPPVYVALTGSPSPPARIATPPPTGSPAGVAPATGGGSAPTTSPAGGGAPRAATGTSPTSGVPGSAPAAGSATTTTTTTRTTKTTDAARVAARPARTSHDPGGGSATGFVVFGVVAAALGAAVVIARRTRRA